MDAYRLGRQIRALRRRRGWTQLELARRSGTSQSSESRLELAEIGGMTVGTIERVVATLNARLDITVRWNGELLDRLLDAAHAELVESTVRLLKANDWDVSVEVPYDVRGDRGRLDIFAWHPTAEIVVVAEVKSVVPDQQAALGALERYARAAPVIARERGLRPRGIGRLLVLGDSRTARRRVAQHVETYAAAAPARGRTVTAWIKEPSLPPIHGLLFLPFAHETGARQRIGRRRGPTTQYRAR